MSRNVIYANATTNTAARRITARITTFNHFASAQQTVFTCVGSFEDQKMFVGNWKELTSRILQRNYKSLNMRTFVMDGETHELGPATAFTKGIKFIFAGN